jgi:DNA-binding LacI/PurR family transcriptional regulator
MTDEIAVGALHAIAEHGYSVPDDISVIGYDNVSLASHVIPPLTTVAQPISEMGEKAADILLRHLRGESETVEHVILPTQLVVRGSTAPPAR